MSTAPHRIHRLLPGQVNLTALSTDATPDFIGGKREGKAALAALGDELSDLQERLWAERTTGSRRRVLLVKCMLHISAQEQRSRLLARLEKEDKYWKFNPDDIDERARWSDYRTAYEIALERTNTASAPWYVVPSDKKWYRNLIVGRLLLETLGAMELCWPSPDFDVDEQRRRLLDEATVS